jgi:hypothetical protein
MSDTAVVQRQEKRRGVKPIGERTVSMKVTPEMWQTLERIAIEEERPMAQVARRLVRRGLEARDTR